MTFSVESKKEPQLKEDAGKRDLILNRNVEYNINRNFCGIPDMLTKELSNFENEQAHSNPKKGTVSIDVTKALVLLGFDSWSSLEPGKYKMNYP